MAFEGMQGGVAVDPATNTLVPTTTTKSDWSTRTPSKEEQAALDRVEAAQGEQQQLAHDDVAAAKEKDVNAVLAADQKAQDAQLNQAALEKANAEYLSERKRIMAEVADLSKQKQKAANFGDYWSDKSTGHKLLSAIAMGLSQGSTIMAGGSGPSPVQLAHQHAQELDMKQKHERLEAVMDELKSRGASLESLDKFHENALKNIEATRLAQDRATAAYIEGLGAKYPQFAAQAAKEAAKLKAESAEKLFTNTAAIHEQRQSGGTSSTVPGSASGSARAPSSTDVQNFAMMQANAKLAERMLELKNKGAVPSPDQYREYMTNKNLAISRAEKEMKEGAFEVWKSKLGRGVNVLPSSVYPKGMTKEQREYIDIEQALSHQRGVKLFGQSAMASPEGRIEYMNPVTASPGDSPADIARKGQVLAEEFIEAGKAASDVSKTGERERAFTANHPTKPANSSRAMTAEHRAALKWAAAHPNDPRAKAAIARIRQETGGQ